MPTPLPEQTNPFEKNVDDTFVCMENVDDKQKNRTLRVDINAAKKYSDLKTVSEEDEKEETSLMQKHDCNTVHQCKVQLEVEPIQPMRRSKDRCTRNCRILKKFFYNVVISVSVLIIFLLINYGTDGKLINFRRHQENIELDPAKTTERTDQVFTVVGGTRHGSTTEKKVRAEAIPSRQPDIGTQMYLDKICLNGEGNTLLFKHVDGEHDGFQRDSVPYNNGYFTIETSGFYFLHAIVSVKHKEGLPSRFMFCVRVIGGRSICRRRQEEPGWVGTVDILDSRLYLEKGQKLSASMNPMGLVFDTAVDTSFNLRLLRRDDAN